jgi:superfamily II DNA/RNA helicase
MDDAIAAMSFDIKSEIEELNHMVDVAKQAEYQYLDIKIEPLLSILDDLYTEEQNRKIIIFTEFVATQSYLKELLTGRDYKVSILNGSMDINARNEILDEFRHVSDILISTDAGGEGLNLQFSNCVINYDLPWNPMKIEQRIGRVDRIGQQRDVVAYNFIMTDTVEARVREVLEEKLSTILKELGVDKYSDVLDGEQTELNFTDAYMRTIRSPKDISYTTKAVSKELSAQAKNSMQIKELIRDKKDLTALVGIDTGIDLDDALKRLIRYFNDSQGTVTTLTDSFNITDATVARHLNSEIEYDHAAEICSLSIDGFPNEAGYFMLWDLSVSADEQSRRILPVFINDSFILRPLAGRKIWEAILDDSNALSVTTKTPLDSALWDNLRKSSQEYAYDTFIKLKEETMSRREENHRKYLYALNLRLDAATRIGIENIRKHKLAALEKERAATEREYEAGKMICPEFKPCLVVRMEGGQ